MVDYIGIGIPSRVAIFKHDEANHEKSGKWFDIFLVYIIFLVFDLLSSFLIDRNQVVIIKVLPVIKIKLT